MTVCKPSPQSPCTGACSVAMKDAHAELGKSAQERHFLGADLACAEPRNRVAAELILDGFKAQRKDL